VRKGEFGVGPSRFSTCSTALGLRTARRESISDLTVPGTHAGVIEHRSYPGLTSWAAFCRPVRLPLRLCSGLRLKQAGSSGWRAGGGCPYARKAFAYRMLLCIDKKQIPRLRGTIRFTNRPASRRNDNCFGFATLEDFAQSVNSRAEHRTSFCENSDPGHFSHVSQKR
jgi:hypothetical protein